MIYYIYTYTISIPITNPTEGTKDLFYWDYYKIYYNKQWLR